MSAHLFLGVNLLSREGYSQTGDRMCLAVNKIEARELVSHSGH